MTPIRLERNISIDLDNNCQSPDGYFGNGAGAQIIIFFPESGRGLGPVTPTIFGIRSKISPKVLELETPNLVHNFVWVMPSRRTNNFP